MKLKVISGVVIHNGVEYFASKGDVLDATAPEATRLIGLGVAEKYGKAEDPVGKDEVKA